MTISMLLTFFACQKTPPATAQPPSEPTPEVSTVESSTPEVSEASSEESVGLVTFSGVNNIVLINADGERIDATDAEAGSYEALAIVKGKDSSGVKDLDFLIGSVTLSKEAPINIQCEIIAKDNTATVDCEVTAATLEEASEATQSELGEEQETDSEATQDSDSEASQESESAD